MVSTGPETPATPAHSRLGLDSQSGSRLEVQHLAKSYGSRKVVKDVSLEVQKGEVVGLLGPNGAGKSQFLQVIAEAFQTVFHACVDKEERAKGNEDLQFEIEYFIRPEGDSDPVHVRLSRRGEGGACQGSCRLGHAANG